VRFLLTSIIALLLSGCLTQPDCVATTSNVVQFRFRDAVSNKLKKVLFSSILISSDGTVLEKTLTETDNVVDSLSTVALPVNSFVKETTYTFTYGVTTNSVPSTKTGSVTVTYDLQNIIVSIDCGPYIYVSNLVMPSYTFEKEPKLLSKQLSTSETVNIELIL
jgi:hypothetical protein